MQDFQDVLVRQMKTYKVRSDEQKEDEKFLTFSPQSIGDAMQNM